MLTNQRNSSPPQAKTSMENWGRPYQGPPKRQKEGRFKLLMLWTVIDSLRILNIFKKITYHQIIHCQTHRKI